MNSESAVPFVISLRDAARQRLPGVDCQVLSTETGGMSHRLCVGLPASYDSRRTRRYPLVLLLDACNLLGSAIEMNRLMAQTREIRECIVVCIETFFDGEADLRRFTALIHRHLLPWCAAHYRTLAGETHAFSPRPGAAAALAGVPGETPIRLLGSGAPGEGEDPLAALVRGLRASFGTRHEYGREIVPLQKPWLMHTLGALAPVIRGLKPQPSAARDSNPHRCWSERLQRHFEVFAALPASAASAGRRYPALFVLDANIEFSVVAETAARFAASGLTEEIAVIGIGVPRSEGQVEFGFRRFEEFSPPAEGYAYDDALGRIFRSLFAIRGQDARRQMGRAPEFHGFLVEELLPQLLRSLPIDGTQLGLLGHSAGGTFVGYALSRPDSPFRRYAGVSPGVGVSGTWLLRGPQAGRHSTSADRVFLCIGSEERSNAFNRIAGIPDTEGYAQQLRGQGLEVDYRCFEDETHSSVYPRAVAGALTALYGRPA